MNTASRVVILADDERCVRMVAAKVLARAGFTVVEAADAESALAALVRHAPAVQALVTDICMPGEINGLELASLARKLFPEIGILISSATVTPTPDVLPADGRFLRKPYSLHELRVQVGILAEHAFHAPHEPALAHS